MPMAAHVGGDRTFPWAGIKVSPNTNLYAIVLHVGREWVTASAVRRPTWVAYVQ